MLCTAQRHQPLNTSISKCVWIFFVSCSLLLVVFLGFEKNLCCNDQNAFGCYCRGNMVGTKHGRW